MTTTTKTVIGTACLAAAICVYMISRRPGDPGEMRPDAKQPARVSGATGGDAAVAANNSRRTNPFQMPRLTAAEQKLLADDPAKAVAGDQLNLDLLVAWAALDPVAALAWVDAQRDPLQSRASLLGAIAAGILIKDGPDAMSRFVAEHAQDPGLPAKYQSQEMLLRRTMFNLGRDDSIHAAMDILGSTKDASLAGWLVLGTQGGADEMARAIDYLEAKGIAVEPDYWSFQTAIDADPRYWADWAWKRNSDLMTDIVQGWYRDHPAEARAWLDDRVPPTDPRRAEINQRITP